MADDGSPVRIRTGSQKPDKIGLIFIFFNMIFVPEEIPLLNDYPERIKGIPDFCYFFKVLSILHRNYFTIQLLEIPLNHASRGLMYPMTKNN